MPLKVKFRTRKTGNRTFIYCRIRLNGMDATDFTTHIEHRESWDSASQHFNCKTMRDANQTLNEITTDIQLLYKELTRQSEISVHDLRNAYVRRAEKRTLLNAYDDHMQHLRKNLGIKKGCSKGTLKAHTSLHNNLIKFLAYKKLNDIELILLRESFGKELIDFCRIKRKYTQNYTVRHINHLKMIIDQEKKAGYLQSNPFEYLIESKVPPGPINFISEAELEDLKVTDLLTPGLRRVADAFLFQCYTGLCYFDMKVFNPDRHIAKIMGTRVIQMRRTKTGTLFTVPVLPYVEELLSKYEGMIPILSNQKMNKYLKEIAKTVGIRNNLTTHVGRKTAGTYLLNNGVPLEVVSKILGHQSVRTTEKIYAELLQSTIIRETVHLMKAA
ncbi:site-specific integrase [Dyadobacter aurulentus]|uniref:site-specific integrase n=1 Tax=Dyadobacter sp. UC 10 TaxID=2605428 RepID=UPI001788E631|nr:site-specific integrase [Dyadobacter sp. UC 10]